MRYILSCLFWHEQAKSMFFSLLKEALEVIFIVYFINIHIMA